MSEVEEIVKIVMPEAYVEKDMRPRANEKDRFRARKAADSLMGGVRWSVTAEGTEFWDSVYSRLMQIANGGPLK